MVDEENVVQEKEVEFEDIVEEDSIEEEDDSKFSTFLFIMLIVWNIILTVAIMVLFNK